MGTHLLFLSQLLAVALTLDPLDRFFVEEPEDSELEGTRPLILGCKFSVAVQECRWLQGGGVLGLKKGTYELAGNKPGDCTLHVPRPKIGVDTTYWHCLAIVNDYTKFESKPARVVVKDYPRPDTSNDVGRADSEIYEPVVYVETNQTTKTVVLDSLVDGDARVRWYVDGVIVTTAKNSVEDKGSDGQLLHSSLSLDVQHNSEPILAQYCLEIRSGSAMKTVHTGSVYVVGNAYEVRENRHKELSKLHLKVTAPKLHMVWVMNNNEQVINLNHVVVQTEYQHWRNFSVRCIDESDSPSTYLRWGQYDPEGDADVIDGGYEFSTTKASREMITAEVFFNRPNRYLTLQCQAGSVIHQGVKRTFSAMFTLRYRNACGENFAELPREATSKSTSTSKQFSLFIFMCIYFTYFFH